MKSEISKIATPPVLRKGVEAYRISNGDRTQFFLRMPWKKETFQIEQWQFFVLVMLPECKSYEMLCSVFQNRFGHTPTTNDVEDFFTLLDSKSLFSVGSQELPVLSSITKWGAVRLASTAQPGVVGATALRTNTALKSSGSQSTRISGAESDPGKKQAPDQPAGDAENDPVAGVDGAIGLDESMSYTGIKLFNPTWILRMLAPLLYPLRHMVYALPFMLIAAACICANYKPAIVTDFSRVFEGMSFAKHVLLGMLTVNLGVTLLSALVAYHSKASVSGFCLVFYMYFFPRFAVRLGNVQQLSRRELMWLHASPLLLRLGFFAAGILAWYFIRMRHDLLAFHSLAVAAIGAISFIITINPLVKSSGCHLLATFINEPRLRGKSFHALMNKISGKVYTQADQHALVAYALASVFFMTAFVAAMVYLLGSYLEFRLGGGAWLLILILGLLLMWRMIKKFIQIKQSYQRSVQYQQWRNRTLPQKQNDLAPDLGRNTALVYFRRSLLVLLVAGLFLPYNYEVGGKFKILPYMQQKITTDIAGIIEAVHYDGGEFVKKGSVIGHLSHSEYITQEKIYAAKMEEQAAIIKELKSQPRAEELQLAMSELETQRTRTEFSKAKAERLEKLFRNGAVSLEDLEDARRDYEVDKNKTEEKISNYQLVKAGANPDDIAAAEAKLKAYQEERDYYRERIAKSIFTMPFDGKIVTMHLKDKIGSYLDKGEELAMVENVNMAKAEIEIPESDIAYVKPKAPVHIRSFSNYEEDLQGEIVSIDQNVSEQHHGRVIKAITIITNTGELLKTGMSGYAKVESRRMPLWKVLSMPLRRFAKVEIWSWLP